MNENEGLIRTQIAIYLLLCVSVYIYECYFVMREKGMMKMT